MIGNTLERFVRAVLARPALWTVITLAIMGVGVVGSTRIELEDDARAMIQGADPEVGRQLAALSEFTAVDQLLLHLDGRAITDPEAAGPRLVAAARRVTEILTASERFDAVRFEADPSNALDVIDTLMPRRFVLEPQHPTSLFSSEALAERLVEVREKLLSPQGVAEKHILLADPVGTLGRVMTRLSTAPGLSKLDAASGRFFSQDGLSLLVIAAPRGNPFGGNDAVESMNVVRQAIAALAADEADIIVRPIGAHRFTEDAQSIIMRDVHTSAALTLIIIMIIFIAFFRRLRLVLVALPPLAFGASVAGGLAGFIGRPVHGIVLAFAAATLGLSIDYTIHLLAAQPHGDTATDRAAALPEAARRIGASLLLAAVSTTAGLFALAQSQVDALQQMALLAAGSVIGAFVGNLLWVPLLLPRLGGAGTAPPVVRGPWHAAVVFSQRRPGLVLVATAVLALALGTAATQTTVDGDLRNLDTHTDAGVADEAAFAESFGDPNTGALALCEGATLDAALACAHSTAHDLRLAGAPRLLSPSVIAPPRNVAAVRRDAWCGAREDIVAKLDEAATGVGFRPASFAGFAADLERLCSVDGEAMLDPRPALDAFEKLVDRPIVRTSGETVRLAVAFEGNADVIVEARHRLPARVVHRTALNQRLVEIIAEDLPWLGGLALVLVTTILVLVFRNLTHPLRALAPCVLGMLATLGILAAADVAINLMNLCVFPLLAGLGIDYGILMADADRDPSPTAASERAFSVTVAAATTLAGFGTLALARYYAIATIGRSVILAVTASALLALVVPVALGRLRLRARR